MMTKAVPVAQRMIVASYFAKSAVCVIRNKGMRKRDFCMKVTAKKNIRMKPCLFCVVQFSCACFT
jgi:hypothetical protein